MISAYEDFGIHRKPYGNSYPIFDDRVMLGVETESRKVRRWKALYIQVPESGIQSIE
jgi:hypothetical protein